MSAGYRDFERLKAMQPGVPRLKDLSHATLPQCVPNFIRAETFADLHLC